MIHAKIMVVDGCWTVVGSTNFDSRSFELNDEVNLAVVDAAFASCMLASFEQDVRDSDPVGAREWRSRPWSERALALLGTVLERQE
jgi:cardiolipin synthase